MKRRRLRMFQSTAVRIRPAALRNKLWHPRFEQTRNRPQQVLGSFAFGYKTVGKFESGRLLRGSRNDQDRNVRVQFLHLSRNLSPGLLAQKMIGNHHVNRLGLEDFESLFSRAGGGDVVPGLLEDELADLQCYLSIVDAQNAITSRL